MKQIPSLNELRYNLTDNLSIVPFANFPGTINCLKDLSVLSCSSNIYPELFHQLSQICCNIQSITVKFDKFISNGINDLISLQHNIKCLSFVQYYPDEGESDEDVEWGEEIPSLIKHSDSLIKLKIRKGLCLTEISFITNFINLEELVLSIDYIYFEDFFGELQDVIFPRLRILKFPYACPKTEILTKFLENHGKNLIEFYYGNDSLFNLTIAKLCPNLRSLCTRFDVDDIEALKIIFNSCQQLESLKLFDNSSYVLRSDENLKVLAKYSPKNFHELKLRCINILKIDLEVFESFLIDWKSRTPQKPLSIIILNSEYFTDNEYLKIIEKYKKLGVIKKFEVKREEED